MHDDDGRLVYAGHVGTGFTDAALKDLDPLLAARPTSPFADALPREITRDARWVEPELVGEVAFAGWTADGRMPSGVFCVDQLRGRPRSARAAVTASSCSRSSTSSRCTRTPLRA